MMKRKTSVDIKTLLLNLGCEIKFSEENDIREGPPNVKFISIVAWISSELIPFYNLDCHVSPLTDSEDALMFLVEVSSVLKELGCPYKTLSKGKPSERLTQSADKKLLITYLCTELETAKIRTFQKPQREDKLKQIIELDESKTARELREMMLSLRLPRPPETVTAKKLFEVIQQTLKKLSHPLTPKETVGELLLPECLTEKQWSEMENLYRDMFLEYTTRRDMLLTRLDVTIQSFMWADRLKDKYEKIMKMYNENRNKLTREPSLRISHVLSVKSHSDIFDKTSNAHVRENTKCSLNTIIIGAVPDRGGRPEEQQPPPPEIPSWQKRNISTSRESSKQPLKSPISKRSAYGMENIHYKNFSRSRDRNSYMQTTHATNYEDFANPQYQPVNYWPSPPQNHEFSFGGYKPAGDNFHDYGSKHHTTRNKSSRYPRSSGYRARDRFR